MPKLSALFQHPIKSCASWAVNELTLGHRGPEGDRDFMVTDENYVFRTQRKEQGGFAKMALIASQLLSDGAWLALIALDNSVPPCQFMIRTRAAAPIQARVHGDTCDANDQGDEAADWLSNFLGVSCRLVRMADTFYRRVDTIFSPEAAQVSFADAYPVLLISDASLHDLNSCLEDKDKPIVSRKNFRSCLWAGDCKPYEEDTWKRIRINGVVFDVVKPCQRCSITQVDWRRGAYRDDKEPLITLRSYRYQKIELTGKSGVMFGQNLVHRGFGTLNVGDEIEILERK